MRIIFAVIFAGLIAALLRCAHEARRSGKRMGIPVMYLLLALIPPLAGNLILILSTQRALSAFGCYVYFIGMDLVMLALLQFTLAYCSITWPRALRGTIWALLSLDAVQLLANLFTGHAFGMEEIMAYGAPYFRLVPHFGQTFHRVLDYGVLAMTLIIFLVKLVRSPRINSERYSVILATMVFTTVWETLYIFSRTPVDRSMVGFGIFGLLVYYFSLYYHPYRLLDRMLATVASEIPYSLFFFDVNGRCIWANKRGITLTGIQDYEAATERLDALLGSTGEADESWSGRRVTGTGDAMQSYVMERRTVTDEKGRAVGSFLTVRDNSDEEKTLQREIYNATHDSLTRVYNRAGYDLLLSNLELSTTLLLLIDGDYFKRINDRYGHEVGDRTLQKLAAVLVQNFRGEDYVCRVGGDEFIVLIRNADRSRDQEVRDRVGRINAQLADTADGLPEFSVSVGAAHGEGAADSTELFEQADRALYETKRAGRRGITFCAGPENDP